MDPEPAVSRTGMAVNGRGGRRATQGAADQIRPGKMTGDGVPGITKLDETNYLQWSTEIVHLMPSVSRGSHGVAYVSGCRTSRSRGRPDPRAWVILGGRRGVGAGSVGCSG